MSPDQVMFNSASNSGLCIAIVSLLEAQIYNNPSYSLLQSRQILEEYLDDKKRSERFILKKFVPINKMETKNEQ